MTKFIDFKQIQNSKDKIVLVVSGRGQGKTQALLDLQNKSKEK